MPATAAVIYNPIKVDLDALKAAVSAEPASADWTTIWLPTAEDDPGQGPTREALEKGATLIIAAGGDGTVRAVAEAMQESAASLALLPSGTGNLLARNLALPLNDTAASLATAYGAGDREIDVASIELRRPDNSVDTHTFLVMAGTGLDAKVMANTDDDLKKRIGWLAYGRALVAALRDKNALRLEYQLDSGRTHSERAQAIIVGNCGALPAGIVLMPNAAIDDGKFDVIVAKPETFRGWLALMIKIFWENGIVNQTKIGRRMADMKTESVDLRQGRTLVLKLSRPEEVQLDGDPFGEMTGCRIAIQPAALTIKVPA